jgi:SAM-dependent methyltransferase
VRPDRPQPDASPAWARFYNEAGGRFAISVAPRIRELYERTETAQSNRSLLDVCGTGQLARHFLDNGYRVTGIDLSQAMLHDARVNAGDHLRHGRARFIMRRRIRLPAGQGVSMASMSIVPKASAIRHTVVASRWVREASRCPVDSRRSRCENVHPACGGTPLRLHRLVGLEENRDVAVG